MAAKKNRKVKKSNPKVQIETPIAVPKEDPSISKIVWWTKPIYIALFLGLFGSLLYVNTWNHEYVYDDGTVTSNNWVVKGGFKNLKYVLTKPYRYGFGSPDKQHKHYRPIPVLMFMTEWAIAPNTPALSHGVNILMYGGFIALLFLLMRDILRDHHPLIPFIATLIFAAHPLHTEVVANIKEREGILCFLFCLLALWLAVKHLRSDKLINIGLLLGIAILHFFGALSKELAIPFVGVTIITYLLIHKGSYFDKKFLTKTGVVLLAYLVPTITFFVLRDNIVGVSGLEGDSRVSPLDNVLFATDNRLEQFWSAIKIMLTYLKLNFWPNPLSADYSLAAFEVIKRPDAVMMLSLVLHGGLLGYGCYAFFKKKSLLGWAILWYFGTMALISNVLVIITTSFAERLTFIPSFGVCVGLAILLLKVNKVDTTSTKMDWNVLKRPGVLGPLVVLVGVYSVLTVVRNPDWKDARTLFSKDVKKQPKSARLNAYYAESIMNEEYYKEKTKDEQADINEEAEGLLRKALNVHPKFALALERFGMIFFRENNPDSAFYYFDKALRYDPRSVQAMNNKAALLFARGRVGEADTLITKSLSLDSLSRDGNFNKGNILGEQGKFKESIRYLERAINMTEEKGEPHAASYGYAGISCVNAGQNEKAKRYLQRALEIQPDFAKVFYFSGLLDYREMNYSSAVKYFEQLIVSKDTDADAFRARGHLYAGKSYIELKDYQKAQQNLAKAYEMNPQEGEAMVALGRLYYDTGNYGEAMKFLGQGVGKKSRKDYADYYYIGATLIKQGNVASGKKLLTDMGRDLKKAADAQPNNKRLQQVLAQLNTTLKN